MSGMTIRNFANANGGTFYNGGVPYDSQGALLVSSLNGLYDVEAYGAIGDGITDDTAAIRSAMTAAVAAKGVVLLGAKTYYMASTIVLLSGAKFKGVGWTFNHNTLTLSGTILKGSGSNHGFTWTTSNGASYVSQPTNPQIQAGACDGLLFEDIAFTAFKRPIYIGEEFNTGCFYSIFRNLIALQCTEWGFYFENCSLSEFQNLVSYNLTNGNQDGTTGGMMFRSSQNAYAHGNSQKVHLYAQMANSLQRGIVFQCRDGSALNDVTVHEVQCNQGTSGKTSTTATFTSGNATIALTAGQGTNFPKDLPVSFDSAAAGFAQRQIYFVIKNGVADGLLADQIQISNTMRGTAVTPNASTTATIGTYGYPSIEICGLNDNSSNNIQSITLTGVDAEGYATCPIFVQRANLHLDINTVTVGQDGEAGAKQYTTICARQSVFGTYRSQWAITLDSDNAGTFFLSLGVNLSSTAAKPIIQAPPVGLYYDSTLGRTVLNLAQRFNRSLRSQNISAGAASSFLYPYESMGQKVSYGSGTSVNLWGSLAGQYVSTSGSATTLTLPALTGGAPEATNATAGLIFEIVTDGAGTVTLNTSGTDHFSYSGSTLTHASVPQGSSITVRASYNGTTAFWSVISNNGATLS